MLGAYIFNFEHLDILRDSIKHPSKKLMSFEFAQSFHIQFRVSWYITEVNRIFEKKVIVVWIWSKLLFSIPIVLIYLGTQSNIWVKVILVCICKKLLYSISSVSVYHETKSEIRVKSYCCLSFLGAYVFNFKRLDILQDSIDIRVKSYSRLNLLKASIFNFECLIYYRSQSDILVKT